MRGPRSILVRGARHVPIGMKLDVRDDKWLACVVPREADLDVVHDEKDSHVHEALDLEPGRVGFQRAWGWHVHCAH